MAPNHTYAAGSTLRGHEIGKVLVPKITQEANTRHAPPTPRAWEADQTMINNKWGIMMMMGVGEEGGTGEERT
jgi:hypothetical protein